MYSTHNLQFNTSVTKKLFTLPTVTNPPKSPIFEEEKYFCGKTNYIFYFYKYTFDLIYKNVHKGP